MSRRPSMEQRLAVIRDRLSMTEDVMNPQSAEEIDACLELLRNYIGPIIGRIEEALIEEHDAQVERERRLDEETASLIDKA